MKQYDYESIALIDVSYLFARNWHAPGGDENGRAATDALREIGRIRSTTSHVVCCLDAPPYARKTLFPEYKAGRDDPGPAFYNHRDRLIENLRQEGFVIASSEGYEADDVMATLAAAFRLVCDDVRLVGPDKDLYQLLNGKVRQFVPAVGDRPETLIDAAGVKERTGVLPSQMVDWQALVGDSSDNVPGCKGCGPKTATGLIERYGSVDNMYREMAKNEVAANRDIGKAMFAKLKAQKQAVMMSRQLVRLQTDAPLDIEGLLEPGVPEERGEDLGELPGARGDMGTVLSEDETHELHERSQRIMAERREERHLTPVDQLISGPDFAKQRDEAAQRNAEEAEEPKPSAVVEPEPEPDPEPTQRPHRKPGEKRENRDPDVRSGADFDRKGTKAELVVSPADDNVVALREPGYELALEPTNMEQAVWWAKNLVASNMFPKLKRWQPVLSIMVMGRELGLGSMASLMNFDIVEGKPAPTAQFIQACAQQHRDCEYFMMVESTPTSATYETKRRGHPVPSRITYTLADAEKAGLIKSRSGWEKHPAAMCRKMAAVALARATYQDSRLCGLYCVEELLGETSAVAA